MNIEIPDEALHEALQAALLQPLRHGHDEPPIRAISRAVIGTFTRLIEAQIRECVHVTLDSESFRHSLRETVATALRDAVKARVHSVVGSITTKEIRTLLAGVAAADDEVEG